MSIVNVQLTASEAQRLTQRIKLTAGSIRENMVRLNDLVAEAKAGNAHVVLGYPSWTAYLAETLGEEPLRLNREERQEVVAMLAGEGMSSRAIAPIVSATDRTVRNDLAGGKDFPPVETISDIHHQMPTASSWSPIDGFSDDVAPESPAAQVEEPRKVTGLDGKSYAAPTTPAPRRKALTDSAKDIGWDLRKAADKLTRLTEDDRYTRNKEEVAAIIRGHLMFTVEVCQDLLDTFNQPQED